MANKIKTSIKTIYGMLWEILALYEETECYNKVPKGADEDDIWDYMGNKLLEVRKEISCLFLEEEALRTKLLQIVDETECFIKSDDHPGVVARWKRINPRIYFFDCAFDLLEESPEWNPETSLLLRVALSFHPGESGVSARKQYFLEAKKKMEEENLKYSEDRVFQDELHRTLTLVFEDDFKEYM